MIKLQVHAQVLAALVRAFPKPANPQRALDKYTAALERLLFLSLQIPRNPEQSKLDLYVISLQKLAQLGGKIGPNKIRIHKWLKEHKLELVQAVTKGSNLTGRLSQVKLTDLVTMTNIRQARIVLGSSRAFNGWYLQRKKPSDFGRMYYEGVSVQNVNKELRRAMLGNCWEYDIRSSVITWKMGFAEQYLKSSGLDGDVGRTFPATLNYLEDKADFMRTVRLYVFDDHSKQAGEFQMKLLKQAFTAMSFGARLASTGWQDQSGHWNNPALVNILRNTQERNRFFNDRSVRAFIKEQNTLDDFLFKEFKTHLSELVKLPCLLTHSGRLSKAKVLAYLYQHGETQVMNIVRASAAANERKPIANVHDAIFFKRRLGVELKCEIEFQMRSQTGNPYWHLTAKELKRYEPRHFDAIAEETAHKRRMAAEHVAALNYVPTGIAQFDISVA